MAFARRMIPSSILTKNNSLYSVIIIRSQTRRFQSSFVNGHAKEVATAATLNGGDAFFRTSIAAQGATDNATSSSNPEDDTAADSNANFIQGETLDLAADLRTFRSGDKLEIPYEMTIRYVPTYFWETSPFRMVEAVFCTSHPYLLCSSSVRVFKIFGIR
jgi:hypothetical protein